jgi:hypothetical protein
MNLKYGFYFLLSFLLVTACSQKKIITENDYEVVELPDGSIVFLSQYSELEYVEAFNQRRVAVSGECYFSVKKSEQSFTVEGHLGQVEVLGTEFIVNSDAENMEVEVADGTVEFKVGDKAEKVSSGRMASFHNGDASIKTGKASVTFDKWMAKLRIELKRLDKDMEKEAVRLEEKLKEKAKEFETEAGKVEKELNKVGKQIEKSLKKITD